MTSCHGLGMVLPNPVPPPRLLQTRSLCFTSPSSPILTEVGCWELDTQNVKITGWDKNNLLETVMW